jgi:hypothetical protein
MMPEMKMVGDNQEVMKSRLIKMMGIYRYTQRKGELAQLLQRNAAFTG